MGQAKDNRRRFDDLLKRFPNCIYCGGKTPATGVDHFPGKIMFDGKDRPKGWEFPACDVCNTGAKHVDLVAACVASLYPEPTTDTQKNDQCKIQRGIANNIPGLIDEMKMDRGAQKIALGELGRRYDVGAIYIGPIAQKYLNIFCQKFALAAHFEATKSILPENGILIGMYLTNFEALENGDLLSRAAKYFPHYATLQQGEKQVSGQFDFAIGFSEEKSMTFSVARFRQSFEVYGTVGHLIGDYAGFDKNYQDHVSSPAKLKALILSL